MKNYVQPGKILTLTAPYDRTSGQGFQIGALFAVAACDALSGASIEGDTCGVFELAKVSAQAWSIGDKIYWDNSAKLCTTVSAGNMLVGVATDVAANPTSTGRLRLYGSMVNDVGTPLTVTMAAATGGSNVTEVTVTVLDAAGNTVADVHNLDLWLSDATTGAGLTGTTASGAVAAKSASGTDLVAYVAKKALRVQTLATGVYILSITDTAKTAFKVCAAINGKTTVGLTLATGDYG